MRQNQPNMQSKKQQKTKITLELKKQIIQAAEMNINHTDIAKRFNICRTSVLGIIKAKSAIKSALANSGGMKRTRIKTTKNSNLEQAILIWFKQTRSQNVPVNGKLLQEKARELADVLKIVRFTASNGWLEKFLKRHSITLKSIQGEAGAVKLDELNMWQQQELQDAIEKYDANDVFNIDECGLFWRLLPNKTLAFINERCTTGKKSKERITVLVGANMTGSEKLPLLVIGKSKNPRCFKNARISIQYLANSNAWMTASIFESWIKNWDLQLHTKNRKILLFLDNCSAHTSNLQLNNIKLQFFLPNTTSLAQPMDQGIIQNLKIHYKRFLLRRKIESIDNKQTFNFNLLDALFTLQRSWEAVTTKTIKNCFGKAQFISIQKEEIDSSVNEELNLLWNSLKEIDTIDNSLVLDDYLIADQQLVTDGVMTLEEIADIFSKEEEEMSIEDINTSESISVTNQEACNALSTLRRYFEKTATDPRMLRICHELDDELAKNRLKGLKQTTLFDFNLKRNK